jgi:NADH-quinone oxidoreductase subunit J
LTGVLFAEVVYLLKGATPDIGTIAIGPKEVGIVLFGPYVIGVELASMLLLAGVVGSYHLGFLKVAKAEIQHDTDTDERRADTGGDLVLAGADKSARTS